VLLYGKDTPIKKGQQLFSTALFPYISFVNQIQIYEKKSVTKIV